MRWLLLVLFLSSCGLSTLLPLGGSGGPTVNSNAQIGKENKQAESRRKEAEDRRSLPQEEAPEEFKEFVKTLGKRSRKTETAPNPAS